MKTRSIAFNTFISSIARIAGSVFAFLSFIVIARSLGPDQFGIYSTAFAFGYTFSALADLGLYSLMTREISKEGSNEVTLVSHFFSLRIVSLVFFLGLVPFILAFAPLPYSPEMKRAILLALPVYFFLSLSQLFLGIFQKYLRLEYAALAEFVSRGIQLLLVGAFVLSGGGLTAFILAAVFGGGTLFFINFIFSRRFVPFHLTFNFSYWRNILVTTFPIAISLMFTLIYFKIDTIMLSLLKTPREVGIYNLGYKFLESVIFFPAMFVGIIFPMLSRFSLEARERFIPLFQKTFDLLVITATPLVFGGWIMAPWIVSVMGGEEFAEASSVFRWLLIAIWLIFLGSLAGNAVIALNRQKVASLVYFVGMSFNIGANLIAIPRFSYNGAAATTVFTELLITTLLLFIACSAIRYRPRFGKLLKTLASSLVMGAVLFLLRDAIIPPLLIIVGVLVYSTCLFVLKGIIRDDFIFLFSPIEDRPQKDTPVL